MNERSEDNVRAISLISGGLDSQLAAKIVLDQGVDVLGLYFETGFLGETDREFLSQVGADLGIEIELVEVDEERYSQLILDPPHGYGSGVNPCIDCRIYILSLTREIMEARGADFVVTGEVLGQRPMTQNLDSLELIKRESELDDRLLRPLSARLLSPSLPEQRGWVSRESLLDVNGRSRKKQLELAEEYGITEYHQPAGGCLLTEDAFARRARELFDHGGRDQTAPQDLKLLKHGRHFRLPGGGGGKAIVGRDKDDNDALSDYLESRWGLRVVGYPGPLTLLPPDVDREDLQFAAAVTGRYSQGRDAETVEVELLVNREMEKVIQVAPLNRDDPRIEKRRI